MRRIRDRDSVQSTTRDAKMRGFNRSHIARGFLPYAATVLSVSLAVTLRVEHSCADSGSYEAPRVATFMNSDSANRDGHVQPRFSWMKIGLRWMSTCTSGESPMHLKPCTSPDLMTSMSPAPASNSSPFTMYSPRPSRL